MEQHHRLLVGGEQNPSANQAHVHALLSKLGTIRCSSTRESLVCYFATMLCYWCDMYLTESEKDTICVGREVVGDWEKLRRLRTTWHAFGEKLSVAIVSS